MDRLTKELQSFLVTMRMYPQSISHQVAHNIEHLFHLLSADNENDVLHYFGILGYEQLSLSEIASLRGISEENMIQIIDKCLRQLAITPEWQIIRQQIKLY
ncbi:MAG: hypothetical protein ACI4V5_04800 [Prevotella sp.]